MADLTSKRLDPASGIRGLHPEFAKGDSRSSAKRRVPVAKPGSDSDSDAEPEQFREQEDHQLDQLAQQPPKW